MTLSLAFDDTQKTESDYLPQQVVNPLAGHIRDCYSQAKSAKQHITERLLRCERQRRGEYDPETIMKIRQYGGSEVFLMLTDIKCRAAEAWIKDVMMSAGENPWEVAPTKEPEIPMELHEQILMVMQQQVMMMQQQGEEVTPEVVEQLTQQMHSEVRLAVQNAASGIAAAMSDRMLDGLQEAKWDDTLQDIIYDFVTFPSCIIKGPIVRRGRAMKWGNNWTPVITDERKVDFARVSPYDAFPSPNATDTQDGYFIERHRFMRQDMVNMKGIPGFSDDQIDMALDRYGKQGLREVTYGESERDFLSGRNNQFGNTEVIEGLEYWGGASGSMLAAWGMPGLDEYEEYQINAIIIGEFVVKAVINPDPMGRRPYSKGSFIRIPGAFWGSALPEAMRDVQIMCNTSARAIANNMGVASGPQVEVSVDRLPDGEDITNMHPWKIWQTTSDRTGGGQPAIRFFQPNMNSEALIGVLQYFSRIADEVTGVPNYIYGSNQVSGAGRTASGLAMLMDNAAKGIKQAILNLDRGVNQMLTRYYYYLMVYDPDQSIKGDLKIVPSGVVGALIKDHINEKRTAFLQMTSNPMDFQIMGPQGRAKLLHQIGAGMQLDMDGVIPDEQALQQMGGASPEIQQAQQMIQQLQQQLMQAQQQLQDKSNELEIKNRGIDAQVEVAKITAEAQIQGRMVESENKARTDAEAKVTVASISSDVQRYVAELKRDSDREMAEYKQEAELKKIEAEKESKVRESETAVRVQTADKGSSDATKQITELIKVIANQPPPVVNVQVDAKGEVKKSIKVKRDKDGNITGAEVDES